MNKARNNHLKPSVCAIPRLSKSTNTNTLYKMGINISLLLDCLRGGTRDQDEVCINNKAVKEVKTQADFDRAGQNVERDEEKGKENGGGQDQDGQKEVNGGGQNQDGTYITNSEVTKETEEKSELIRSRHSITGIARNEL